MKAPAEYGARRARSPRFLGAQTAMSVHNRWSNQRRPLGVRFHEKYRVDPTHGCWLWLGATGRDGYGNIGIGCRFKGNRRTLAAHRVSYELHHGPIPPGMFVCHKCDVKACVNPTHLFVATHAQNMADMIAKGRHKTPAVTEGHRIAGLKLRGEGQPLAKLTSASVAAIRARRAAGELQRHLALEFGVSTAQISRIINGKRWVSATPTHEGALL